MDRLYLIAEAGGSRFAIEAELVESVVSAAEIISVPLAEPWVAGVAALRSNVVTVIDTEAAIEGRSASVRPGWSLVVVKIDDFLYGLAVDDVHDVVDSDAEPERLGASFSAGWQRVSTGIISVDGDTIVVIDPAALFAGAASEAA